jgi:hypothetical protein
MHNQLAFGQDRDVGECHTRPNFTMKLVRPGFDPPA